MLDDYTGQALFKSTKRTKALIIVVNYNKTIVQIRDSLRYLFDRQLVGLTTLVRLGADLWLCLIQL